jgi:outer membrane protein
MINFYNIFLLSILVISVNNSMASTDINIQELYVRALQYDDVYLNAISDLDIERLDLNAQRSGLFPSITSSIYRTEVESKTTGPQQSVTSNGRYTSEGFQVQLTQVVYDKALIKQLESYDYLEGSIKNNIIVAKQDLILRVAGAYWSLMLAEQSLIEEQKKYNLSKLILKQATEKSLRGLISRSELNQVESDELEQSYQKTLAEFDLELARNELFQLTLWEFKGSIQVVSSCPVKREVDVLQNNFLNFALQNNSQLNVLRDELKAYQMEQSSKNSAYLPKVNLTADYSNSDQSGGTFDGSETDRTQVKLSLDWPVYLGGKRYSEAKKANYKLAAHQRKIELYVPKLKHKLFLLMSRLKNGLSNFNNIENAVKIRKQRYKIMKNEKQIGSITELDMLQERLKVEQLTTKYVSACKDQVLNQLEFYKLLGTLSVDQLEYR